MNEQTSIQLTAVGDRGTEYCDVPVTFGVPLCEGQLRRDRVSSVALMDPDGNQYPVSAACAATWRTDLKHAKWLLVDTRVSLEAGQTEKRLLLNLDGGGGRSGGGPGAGEEATDGTGGESRVHVSDEGDSLLVDTGAMRARLRQEFPIYSQPYSPDFFTSCKVRTGDGWRELLKGEHGIHLYMTDSSGVEYDSCTKGFHPRVVVEEHNRLRCCIKVEGLHHSLDGRTFCPYVLRLHFYAGRADVKIFHTFVFNQNPEFIALSSVGIRIPVDVGRRVRAGFSGTDRNHIADDWRDLQFAQTGFHSYSVQRDGSPFGSGEANECWAAMLGERGSVAAVFRDGRYEYPFGFEIKPGLMDVAVWPGSAGRPLEFSTPYHEPAIMDFNFDPYKVVPGEEEEFVRIINERPTAPISVKHVNPRSHEKIAWVEEMLEKHAQGRVIGYNDMGYGNGVGAAKTSEIHLQFSGGTVTESDVESLAAAVHEPLVILAEPTHVCASGVFGPFYHAGDPLFDKVDRYLDRVTREVSFEPDELCEYYGKMRYGNLPGAHSNPSHWLWAYYRKRDPSKAARRMGPFNNEANDEVFAFWGGFIRTGRRDCFLRAQKFSRCVADVSTVHADPERPENVGGMHGHNSHSWTGGVSKSHTLVAGYLADYYFTGNRRLLDVAEEAATRIFDCHQERIGIIANSGGLLREYVGPISVLLDVYRATWKEKYRWLAERSLDVLLKSRNEQKYMANSIRTSGFLGNEILVKPPGYPEVAWGNRYLVYESALQLFGVGSIPALERLIVDEADYYAYECPVTMGYYEMTAVCYAYQLTGDPAYAAFAKWVLDEVFESFMRRKDEEGAIAPAEDRVNGYVPKLMWLVKDAMERDAEAFERACSEWKRKRAETPGRPEMERPDAAPFSSLGYMWPLHDREGPIGG